MCVPSNSVKGISPFRFLRENQRGKKGQLKWHGPFWVVKFKCEYIFAIEHLITHKTEDAHGRRLNFFRQKDFEDSDQSRFRISFRIAAFNSETDQYEFLHLPLRQNSAKITQHGEIYYDRFLELQLI